MEKEEEYEEKRTYGMRGERRRDRRKVGLSGGKMPKPKLSTFQPNGQKKLKLDLLS